MSQRFEPRFYERAAQTHLAAGLTAPLWLNVTWGTTGAPATRSEIDALFRDDETLVAVEIKSHTVGAALAGEITAKYATLGFRRVLVVAPEATSTAYRLLGSVRRPRVAVRRFVPDLEAITAFYAGDWQRRVPVWVHDTLASGQHHLRVVRTVPDDDGRLVVGQPRSRMYTTERVAELVKRLPVPPARVLWTPARFTIPRDAIAAGSRLTPVGGFVAVDIDGDTIHRPRHACQLPPGAAVCPCCLACARAEYERLTALLPKVKWRDMVFSGGRGIHAYVCAEEDRRSRLVSCIRRYRVRCDVSVTASVKATIALPGSLHAGTMLPVADRQPASLAAVPGGGAPC